MILVGRSYARLLDAARRLEGPDSALRVDGEVATRAPEEDQQDRAKEAETGPMSEEKRNGTLLRSSEKINLLVGDVAQLSTGGWMRELEREMVSSYSLI